LRTAGTAHQLSLDTLDPAKFRAITRWAISTRFLGGHRARAPAGLPVKINAVSLKISTRRNPLPLMEWRTARAWR